MLRAFAGGTLFGERSGEGRPWVLALHGWQRSHADFTAVLDGAVPLDAIALDLPGFGAAPTPPGPWGSPDYARHIAPILEEMSERIVVCAHSFGGRVALHLAAQHPERVAALVLTGVPLLRPEPSTRRPAFGYRLIRALARARLVSPTRLEQARRRFGSTDYRNASPEMRAVLVRVLGEDYRTILGGLEQPIELVWGELDTEAPVGGAQAVQQGRAATTQLLILPGIDHFVPNSAPLELRAAIERHRP